MSDGQLQDDNGALCNLKGLLVDAEGNIVDKHMNILFEKHILQEGGRLPALFKKTQLLKVVDVLNDEQFSTILNQIEDETLLKPLPPQPILEDMETERSPTGHRTFEN